MTQHHFTISLSTPDIANDYQADLLDSCDKKRTIQNPKLHNKLDWQASRALKQTLPKQQNKYSLSHKKGHIALLSTHLQAACIGIDIEYCQNRNFLALSQLCCTPKEQEWLAKQPNTNTAFYQLWTLKEALIKAHRGQLTDMPKWSLIHNIQQGIQLPPHSGLQGFSTQIHGDWFIGFVVPEHVLLSDCHIKLHGLWSHTLIQWHRFNPCV